MKKYFFGTIYGVVLSALLFFSLLITVNEYYKVFKLEDPNFTVLMNESISDGAEQTVRSFYKAIYNEDQFLLNRTLSDQILFHDENGETVASSSAFISEQIKLWRTHHYWHRLHDVVVDREIISPVRVLVTGVLAVQLDSDQRSALESDYTVPFSEAFEIEDGKITRRTTYLNQKNIERQVADN